jgi:outer membrane lipoprotein SlyB
MRGEVVAFLRLLSFLAPLICGAGIAAAASAAPPAALQRGAVAAAALVDGFDLEQVDALTPGVPLNFNVYGSPRAAVTLYIEGVDHLVDLDETQPGIYEGSYVIDANDRIRPDSHVIATLQRDGQVARSTLAEPLLLERGAVPWADDATRPTATPPAPAIAVAPSAEAPARPSAARSGVPVPFAAPGWAPTRAACGDCAVVESIRAEAMPERRGIIGAIAGGIAGAVLGEQLAEAHRRHVMQVLVAVTGALLGREIELRQAPAPAYSVVLRLPDGSALERRYEQPPPFKVGDSVSLSGSGTRATRSAIF